jgi:hypothetical protein
MDLAGVFGEFVQITERARGERERERESEEVDESIIKSVCVSSL